MGSAPPQKAGDVGGVRSPPTTIMDSALDLADQLLSRIANQPHTNDFIKPELYNNKNILVVAHGNSLRAMMICIGLYKPDEISKIEIPTGSPFVFYYQNSILKKSEYLF